MLKKESKIRRLLGKNYHLNSSTTGEWRLYKKYDDFEKYMSSQNKPIMTNKTNTEKDLLKFAKGTRKIDERIARCGIRVITTAIVVILSFVNFKLKSKLMSSMILGIDVVVLLDILFQTIIDGHNLKASYQETAVMCGFRPDFDISKRWQIKNNFKHNGINYCVSTVDLGINNNFLGEKPLCYETMVFTKDKKWNEFQERYETKSIAKKRHKEIVKYIKSGGDYNE